MARELVIRIQVDNTAQSTKALADVEQGLKGVEAAGGKVKTTVGEGSGETGTGLVGSFGKLAKAASAIGATLVVKNVVEWGSSLENLSAKTGVSVEGLQRLAFVGGKVDVSIEQITRGINTLQKRLAGDDKSAAAAVEELAKKFPSLNLSVDGLLRLAPDQMFIALGDAIRQVTDPAERLRLTTELMKSPDLLPVLSQNIREVGASASVMSDKAVKGLDTLSSAWASLKNFFLSSVGEAVGSLTSWDGALEHFVKSATGHSVNIKAKWAESMQMWANIGQSIKSGVTDSLHWIESLYTGIKTWLVDKFTGVVESVKGKVEAVTGFFKDMYDKVVGRSYVPDMIEGIAQEFQKLDRVMVVPTVAATARVENIFQNMMSSITNQFTSWGSSLAGSISGLISGPIGKALGGVAAGLVSGLGSILTGGISSLVQMGVDLAIKGITWAAKKIKQAVAGNETNETRQDFARELGFANLDALYQKLRGSGPQGEFLANVGLNVIGKHDYAGNEKWMQDVQALLGQSTTASTWAASNAPASGMAFTMPVGTGLSAPSGPAVVVQNTFNVQTTDVQGWIEWIRSAGGDKALAEMMLPAITLESRRLGLA